MTETTGSTPTGTPTGAAPPPPGPPPGPPPDQPAYQAPPPPGAAAGPPPVGPRPPLRRSRDDRVVAGVCAGVARTLGIDPVVVRVLVAVLAVFGGVGLVAYLVGWLLIPDDGAASTQADALLADVRTPGTGARTTLIVLAWVAAILVGLGLLVGAVSGPWFGSWRIGWDWGLNLTGPLLLVAGIALVVWLVRHDRPGPAPVGPAPVGPNPVGPYPPTAPATPTAMTATPFGPGTPDASGSPTPSEDSVSTVTQPPVAAGTYQAGAYPAAPQPGDTGYAYGGYGGYGPPPAPVTPAPLPAPPAPPRPRSYLGAITLSVAVITAGILGSLAVTGAANVPAVVVLAVPLGILGLGLIVGAFAGRALWLIALAVPLLLITQLASVLPANLSTTFSGGVGDRTWRPTTVAEVPTEYRLGVGDARLDLTGLRFTSSTPVRVTASVGTGQLIVIVPPDATVVADARVSLGELRIPTGSAGTVGSETVSGGSLQRTFTLTPLGGDAAGRLDLLVEVGIGNLEVRRAAS